MKTDGKGARHSQIDLEIQKRAMLYYSIQALVSTSSYTAAPWNGTSFPQHPVAVMACRMPFVAAAESPDPHLGVVSGAKANPPGYSGLRPSKLQCLGFSGQGRDSWVELFKDSCIAEKLERSVQRARSHCFCRP